MNENIKFFDFLYYFLFGILISFIKIKENKNKLKKLIFFVLFLSILFWQSYKLSAISIAINKSLL